MNAFITATYWAVGRRIVEEEQHGEARAGYGEELIERLSRDLTARVGRGFGRRNLSQMRAFYLAYREIPQTASAQSDPVSPSTKCKRRLHLGARSGEPRLSLALVALRPPACGS
jgi:DUF1016 N-terminal domain